MNNGHVIRQVREWLFTVGDYHKPLLPKAALLERSQSGYSQFNQRMVLTTVKKFVTKKFLNFH